MTKNLYSAKEGRSVVLISSVLFFLYRIKLRTVRSLIRWFILKIEGNTLYSLTIRRIFETYYGVRIGMYSSVGCFMVDNFKPDTVIGRYCVIYGTARAFSANHPTNTISSHSFFYNPIHGYAKKNLLTRTKLTIGNDVFIGHNAIILPSVTSIGDGAIIGAGAVVHTDIPPYAVVVGNPGRIVRYRFSEKTIKKLSASKWWEKSIQELNLELHRFQTPVEGKEIY